MFGILAILFFALAAFGVHFGDLNQLGMACIGFALLTLQVLIGGWWPFPYNRT